MDSTLSVSSVMVSQTVYMNYRTEWCIWRVSKRIIHFTSSNLPQKMAADTIYFVLCSLWKVNILKWLNRIFHCHDNSFSVFKLVIKDGSQYNIFCYILGKSILLNDCIRSLYCHDNSFYVFTLVLNDGRNHPYKDNVLKWLNATCKLQMVLTLNSIYHGHEIWTYILQ